MATREDDERKLLRVIHSILCCAKDKSEGLRNYVYLGIAEPRIVPLLNNRYSDEAVLESIFENDVMSIILEVKGES